MRVGIIGEMRVGSTGEMRVRGIGEMRVGRRGYLRGESVAVSDLVLLASNPGVQERTVSIRQHTSAYVSIRQHT
jgi:hypothetical protein